MLRQKITSFGWKIILFLIFLRPFFSEFIFLAFGFWYIFALIFFCGIYLLTCDKKKIFSSSLNLPVLSFMAILFISVISSGLTQWSEFQLYLFIPNFLIFYVISTLDQQQKKQTIRVLIFSATLISIYALYQYLLGFQYLTPDKYTLKFIETKRAFASFLSPNLFAGYMAMILLVGIGFFCGEYRQRNKILWIVILAMLLSLLFTKSLGVIFVFIFMFFIFLALALKPYNLSTRKTTLIAIFIFAALIFILFILRHRLWQLFDLNAVDNSISQRLYYWLVSLKVIKEYPFLGVGWFKLGDVFLQHKTGAANFSSYSHNIFLQLTAETGILGLFSFTWLVSGFLKLGLKRVRTNAADRLFAIGLFCAGLSFLLYNLVDFSFFFGQVSFFWWIILGLFTDKGSEEDAKYI